MLIRHCASTYSSAKRVIMVLSQVAVEMQKMFAINAFMDRHMRGAVRPGMTAEGKEESVWFGVGGWHHGGSL